MYAYQQKEQKATNANNFMKKKQEATVKNADTTIDLEIEVVSEIDDRIKLPDNAMEESVVLGIYYEEQPEDTEHQEDQEDRDGEILKPVTNDLMLNSFNELRNSMLGKISINFNKIG